MGKLKMAQVDLRKVTSEEAFKLVQWPCRDCGEVGRACECESHDEDWDSYDDLEDDRDLG